MTQKKVRASAFVDATLTTTAQLTFIDDGGEGVTDTFKVVYYALSPRRARELDEWVADFDKRVDAFNARRAAHDAAEARRRLQHDAAEAEREERAAAANEPFTPRQFVEVPFVDEEEEGLQHALAQFVARLVHSIPEIVGEDDQPLVITADTLAGFAGQNLRAIRDAVLKDTATDPTKPVS
ncbi:MAG TPA: hypothetical protein VGB98_10870 [Pyrinomonadaceae bacterium]|jgi:hypothetical protein